MCFIPEHTNCWKICRIQHRGVVAISYFIFYIKPASINTIVWFGVGLLMRVFFLKRSPGLDSNFLLLRLINKSVLNILEVSFSSVKLVMFTNTLLNNILRIFTTADSAKYHYYTSSTNFNRLHSYLRDYHRTAICYLFRILFVQLFSMNSPLPIRLTLGYS